MVDLMLYSKFLCSGKICKITEHFKDKNLISFIIPAGMLGRALDFDKDTFQQEKPQRELAFMEDTHEVCREGTSLVMPTNTTNGYIDNCAVQRRKTPIEALATPLHILSCPPFHSKKRTAKPRGLCGLAFGSCEKTPKHDVRTMPKFT